MFTESPQSEVPKSFYPNIGQSFRLLIRLILITILFSIPFGIVLILNERYEIPHGQLLISFLLLLAQVASLYIVARLGFKRIRKFDMPEYRWKFNREPIQVILVIAVMTIAASTLVSPLTALIPGADQFNQRMSEIFSPNLFLFLSIVVAAPLLEEIVFRGVILEGLLKNYSPAKAIIWSSVIFSIAHLNLWQAVGTFSFGLLMGWVYWKSNSIIPGMVIHFVNNLVGYLMISDTGGVSDSLSVSLEDTVVYGIVLLIALGIFILTWRWLNKRWASPTPEPAL